MSDLLKQAIADAKAVRATALANAKAALEEAFTPKIQSMLAEKLKQEVEGAEEVPAVEPTPAPEAHADAAQDAAAFAAPAPEVAPEPAPVAEEEEIDEDAIRGTTAAELDPTLATTHIQEADKASSNYKTKTKGHKTQDPQGASNELSKGASKDSTDDTSGEPKSVADVTKALPDYKKTTSGHKTQDPQGASHEISKGASKNSTDDTSALKENEEEVDEASLDEILAELEASVNEVGMEEAVPVAEETDEEINLDELLSESEDEENEEETVDEGKLPPGLAKYQKEKAEKEGDHDKKEKTDESIVNENLSLKKELAEYRSAVEYLRNQINEINLLNAKLLYTNKLFKSATLNNEQKMKVIESFDLTKSVREAKLVYATLAESFSFGGKKTVEAAPAKKQVSGTVKTITEGLASKSVASTKPTKPAVISEGAEMANRFKKLAGIRN